VCSSDLVIRHLANELKTFGHEICFVSDAEGDFAKEARSLGEVKVAQIPSVTNTAWKLGPVRLPGLLQTLRNLQTVRVAKKNIAVILQELQPDVVIGRGVPAGPLFGGLCSRMGIRLVICLHGVGVSDNDIFSLRAKIASRYLNRADMIVGVSNAINKRYAPFLRVPSRTIYNCPRPMVLDKTFAESFRQEKNILPEAIVIGGAGRMNYEKGHHVLIDAIKLLHDKGIDVYCVIAGGCAGSQKKHYETLLGQIKQYELDERVFMPGFMTMERFLAIIDIFCHTYIGQEGLGLTILEAMQAGKPVIATNAGGPQEIIRTETEGILISADSAELLSSAIQKLTVDTDRRATMSENGMKRTAEAFNYSEWALKWDTLLRSVVTG